MQLIYQGRPKLRVLPWRRVHQRQAEGVNACRTDYAEILRKSSLEFPVPIG